LYRNVDYDLLRQAFQDLYRLDIDTHEDSFDAIKRVIERKIQEATGMKMSKLLMEKGEVRPLFRKNYKQSKYLH
jgi:translation elongation factor EF-4